MSELAAIVLSVLIGSAGFAAFCLAIYKIDKAYEEDMIK